MSKLIRSRVAFAAGLIAGIFILAACGSSKPTETPVPPTRTPTPTVTPTPVLEQPVSAGPISTETQATVRFVLAIPDASPVAIYIGTTSAVSQLPYGALSPRIPKAPGKYLVRAIPAGSSGDNGPALLQQYIDVTARQSALMILTGTADKPALTQINQNTDPVNPGTARVEVVHAMQGDASGSKIDVTIDGQASGSLTTAGQRLDLGAQKASTHTFRFIAGPQVLLTQSTALDDNQVYTLVLCGSNSATAALAIASSPTQTSTRLRVLNMSSGPLDVYVGDQQVGKAIASHQNGDWITVPTYASSVRVLKAGADASTSPLYKGDLALRGDQGGDLVIYDQAKSTRARIFWEDLRPTTAKTARLSILNMAADTPGIQVLLNKVPFPNIPPVPNTSMSISASVPAGTKQIAFNSYGDLTSSIIEEAYSPVVLNEGTAYLYVVTGAGTTTSPLLLSTTVGVDKASIVPTPAPTNLPPDRMQVRIINANLSNTPLDIHVGSRVVFGGFKRGQISGPLLITAQETGFVVTAPGGTTPLAGSDITFKAGTAVTLVVVGGGGVPFHIAISLNDIPTETDAAIVQVVHAGEQQAPRAFEAVAVTDVSSAGPLPTATPGDIPNSIKLTDQIAWSTIVDAAPLAPGKYLFFTRESPDTLPTLMQGPFTIEAGKHYELMLVTDNGAPRLIFLPLNMT